MWKPRGCWNHFFPLLQKWLSVALHQICLSDFICKIVKFLFINQSSLVLQWKHFTSVKTTFCNKPAISLSIICGCCKGDDTYSTFKHLNFFEKLNKLDQFLYKKSTFCLFKSDMGLSVSFSMKDFLCWHVLARWNGISN